MKGYNRNQDLKQIAANVSVMAAAGAYRQYLDDDQPRAEFVIGTLKLRCIDTPEAIQALIRRYDKNAGKVKPILSPAFKWCAKAVAKNDSRLALNYVYVTGQWLIGCDGHRIHKAPNTENRAPGYYLKNGERERDDLVEGLEYPNIDRITPRTHECDPVAVGSLEYLNKYSYHGEERELAIARYSVPEKQPITVNRQYLADALAGLPDPWILAQRADNLYLESKVSGGMAVVMGIRCES